MEMENLKMVSERCINHPSGKSSEIASSQESQTQLLIFNLFYSLSIGLLISFLPREDVDRFLTQLLFYCLVMALMLTFAGAASGLLIVDSFLHATVRRLYLRISVVSMASTLIILSCCLFLEIYRLLPSSLFKVWQPNKNGANSLFVYRYVFRAFRNRCAPASEELSELN